LERKENLFQQKAVISEMGMLGYRIHINYYLT